MTGEQKKQARALLKAFKICNETKYAKRCKECPYYNENKRGCFCFMIQDAEKFIKEALEEALRKDNS